MKKGLYGFTAFMMALALVGCGADNEKSEDKAAENTTSATTEEKTTAVKETEEDTTAEDTTKEETLEANDTEDDDKDQKDDKKTDNIVADPNFEGIAGTYHKNGHMAIGKYPDELDPKAIGDKMKDDPMVIYADGTLHFAGKDYKLIAEGVNGEENVFSIEGSGFDMAKYIENSRVSDEDYEGPCAFVSTKGHYTLNDEDCTYDQYLIYLTAKGSESYFGYIQVDTGEESSPDWSFDW